jgi:hypothetical protein
MIPFFYLINPVSKNLFFSEVDNFKLNEHHRSVSRNLNQSPVEKWLKNRFREGFLQMKDAFEATDVLKTKYVCI